MKLHLKPTVLGMIHGQLKEEFLDNLQKLCKTTPGICSTVMEPILERGHGTFGESAT